VSNQRSVLAPAGQPTISFSREFDADAARVFAAHTDPDQVARWIGPRGTTLAVREFDARTGGHWSYVVHGSGGRSWRFHGSFHEVTAPSRLVQTFEFEDDPGHPNLEVLTFTDLGAGRSRLEGLATFLTVEDRDEMRKDMEPARDEDFERLDELLAATARG
jgi:uncharacterized protein YndB with AHSA1/START domain